MMRALIFAAGAAVGFVLGARAGRGTYTQFKDHSLDLWHNPAVQEKVTEAKETVKEKVPAVQEKVGALVKKAGHQAGTYTGPGTASDTDVSRDESAVTPPAADERIVPPLAPGKHSLGPT